LKKKGEIMKEGESMIWIRKTKENRGNRRRRRIGIVTRQTIGTLLKSVCFQKNNNSKKGEINSSS